MGPADVQLSLFWRLAIALGAGIFVGLEREHRGKSGVRTFAFVCLIGTISGALGDGFALVALGLVAVLVVLLNQRQLLQHQTIELTTSAALFLVAFIGILIGRGQTFVPVALAVTAAAFLSWKQPLHEFAGRISEGEIRSAVILALLTLVVFPLLPDRAVDPWQLVNPRSAWLAVIVLAVLGWTNYLLWKIYGSRGLALASLLGGLVNSTAAAAEMAQRAHELGGRFLREAAGGIVLATAAMLVRNAVIAGALAPTVLGLISVPVIAMVVASIAVLGWMKIRHWGATTEEPLENRPLHFGSPFSLSTVLKFGLFFLGLEIAGTLGQRAFGELGFYIVCVAGGLFSSSSAVAAAGTLAAENTLPPDAAATGALLAIATSTLVSFPVAARFGRNPRLTRVVLLTVIAITVVGALAWLAQRLLLPTLIGA